MPLIDMLFAWSPSQSLVFIGNKNLFIKLKPQFCIGFPGSTGAGTPALEVARLWFECHRKEPDRFSVVW